MKDLSIYERFALISLNSVRNSEQTAGRYLKDRCIVAAVVIDMIFSGAMQKPGGEYLFAGPDEPGLKDRDAVFEVYKLLKDRHQGAAPLASWMRAVVRTRKKDKRRVEETVAQELMEAELLSRIPALIACDLFFSSSDLEVTEYRAQNEQYHAEIEYIRAETLDAKMPSEEVIALLWLFKQSGGLTHIFSGREYEQLQGVLNRIYREDPFGRELFALTLGDGIFRKWNSILSFKKDLIKSQFGIGFVSRIPFLQRSEAIFIESEKMFANAWERLTHVVEILEAKGHVCAVKSEGAVPLVEIDNVLYELIPDAIAMKYLSIHGVRLRRYLL